MTSHSSPGTLRVESIRSWTELDAVRGEWDALLAASDAATAFLSYPWVQSWRDVFGGAGTPLVLLCRSDAGVIRGIAPLFICTVAPLRLLRAVRFIGDLRSESGNLDVIAERGYEATVVDAVLTALEGMRDLWDLLELRHVARESCALGHLRAGAMERGWLIEERSSPHLIIDLASSWEAVLARMSRNGRKAATHTDRNLPSAGVVESRHCERREDLPYFFDALFRLHTERWTARGELGNLRDPERRAFYQRLALRFLECGQLDFDLLELNGAPVAAHFGFRYATTYYQLESGFDPAYARFGTGVGLTSRVIRRVIADGIAHYDFLEGDEPYRLRWSPRISRYVHLRMARPRTRGAGYMTAIRAGARWRNAVRERYPRLWGLAHRARGRTSAS